ncbi:single-stranded-DNA-specific exonuclease RecJ [Salicibibacter cibarius]|uniref:Single-stranded-DNA-specific exonuclease RecJ n=1 Tax=Salicibibacter cibarius TaxID=2743000 RepID=A0A7T7CB79_9BACI|nr:single-stranded-DNA-specific exonuclease RecJ [Salicibibacter cibarius]QQK75662.1 single-stranded-DNA-specific exonuclease RecJ [Salicibibacter cibarius]
MLDAKTRWKVRPLDTRAKALAGALRVSERTAHLLCRRGMEHVEDAHVFLHTDESILHDPFALAGMEDAVSRIKRAVNDDEKIVVFGDYDVDGVSSTALMCETLEKMGASYDWYVPNRFTEGYGPNSAAFQKLQDEGCTLVITVDTGIAAAETINAAQKNGLDVIVTDHHEAPPELPDALAIINPKQMDCPYPFKELAGVGVVSKLAHALLDVFPEDGLDLIALGTISDLVELVDENRFFAKAGLPKLDKLNRSGLQALKEISGIKGPPFSEETVGFGFGPRLNAAGRMDSAAPAVQLLLTSDPGEAQSLAEVIDGYNRERQQTVEKITEEALAQLQAKGEDLPAIVVAGKGWNSGVTGIVASRLVEKYYRPTIVIALDDEGSGKGSARSIEGFDLYQSLSKHVHLFSRFGGHRMAAGLSIDEDKIPDLRATLEKEVNGTLPPESFVPTTDIELTLSVEEVTTELIREIEELAPFGVGNPKPLVQIENIPIQQKRKIGSMQNHLKMSVGDAGPLDCVGFRLGHLHDRIQNDANIHLAGELSVNEWKGNEKPQIILRDVAVKERQVFDVRGGKDLQSLTSISDGLTIIIFQKDHAKDAREQGFSSTNFLFPDEESLTVPTDILFLDLPEHLSDLTRFLNENESFIRSIYTGFMEKGQAFFTAKPTREAFKWLYVYVKKYAPLHLREHEPVIAKYQGWSTDTIHFMLQVFTELEFVTLSGGKLVVNEHPLKQDLQASSTYRSYEEKREIEETLKYSTYQALKAFLFACMPDEKKQTEVLTDGL